MQRYVIRKLCNLKVYCMEKTCNVLKENASEINQNVFGLKYCFSDNYVTLHNCSVVYGPQ